MIIALHGGAGTLPRRRMSAEKAREYLEALRDCLAKGHSLLLRGRSALDAVTATVVALEDCPLFNAGRGAVFNADGEHEMDAAVMDGATARAGAVAGVQRIRNPILAARAVMEKSPHVLLAAEGAERFAKRVGLPLVSSGYFSTPERRDALERKLKSHHGTVGAVALDARGRLAAATSTGGYTGKLPGRIGDSPIIGAGTWADATCAVSGTGLGEAFIRAAVAHDISARMRYRKETLGRAAAAALRNVKRLGGDGGVIAV
ncbi:MAG TPA: isoaspartyl peptidase/L-asparaginase, partial [Burkholderiales bacterium]|nr:isoaspartyl peptidase/L-asparaginase [Burkholderiales bacterium]